MLCIQELSFYKLFLFIEERENFLPVHELLNNATSICKPVQSIDMSVYCINNLLKFACNLQLWCNR